MTPSGEDHRLLEVARATRANAYAPYSEFPVGAALADASGAIHVGANVENSSYGVTLCAEVVALGAAVTAGARSFDAIAIVGPEDRESLLPCGRCRQLLHEFSPSLTLVTVDPDGNPRRHVLRDLLPEAFGSAPAGGG